VLVLNRSEDQGALLAGDRLCFQEMCSHAFLAQGFLSLYTVCFFSAKGAHWLVTAAATAHLCARFVVMSFELNLIQTKPNADPETTEMV
jgi:hypothetical protein